MPSTRFPEILEAFFFASASAPDETEAWICLDSGAVYCWSDPMICGDEVNEGLPEDLHTSDRYLQLPGKHELDLGQELVFRFVEERLPADEQTVLGFFRQRGAWGKFKDLLVRRGQRDAWHAYEAQATETALRAWCAAHELSLAP